MECMSSSSSVASDDSDGDEGLLSALLGPPSFGSAKRTGSPRPVPRWRLAREGPFLSEIPPSGIAGFGHGCAFRNTTYRPSDYALWEVWTAIAPPLVSGMDRRPGVGSSAGQGS